MPRRKIHRRFIAICFHSGQELGWSDETTARRFDGSTVERGAESSTHHHRRPAPLHAEREYHAAHSSENREPRPEVGPGFVGKHTRLRTCARYDTDRQASSQPRSVDQRQLRGGWQPHRLQRPRGRHDSDALAGYGGQHRNLWEVPERISWLREELRRLFQRHPRSAPSGLGQVCHHPRGSRRLHAP